MIWFGIGCAFGGLLVGLLLKVWIFILLTSLQILIVLFALTLAGELSGISAFVWGVCGLCFHQAAYLVGALLRVIIDERSAVSHRSSVAAQVEEELSGIEHLACRVASLSPQLRPEAAILSYRAAQLRRTLEDGQKLEALILERRKSARPD